MTDDATPPPGDNQQDPTPEPDFETALARLEQIIGQLEQGELGLNESLRQYEEGVACLRVCQRALSDAEGKIELLFRIDEDGQAEVRPFDHQQTTLEEKQAARSARRSQRPDDEDDQPRERGLF